MKKHFIKQKPFCSRSSAKKKRSNISDETVLDLGALNSVGVFETLRAYRGKFFRLEEHLARLSQSCLGMGRVLPVPLDHLRVWAQSLLRESGFEDIMLRLSIYWEKPESGKIVAVGWEFKSHPEEWYQKGVALRTAVHRRALPRAQDPQIKSSQFVSGVMAILDRGENPAHELLFLGPTGVIAEGTVSNVFIVKAKCLLTPTVHSGILKGATRQVVMEAAEKEGIKVLETMLSRHELYTADECFMTNTSSEVLPVISVDNRRIGSGSPGPVTQRLAQRFKKIITHESQS